MSERMNSYDVRFHMNEGGSVDYTIRRNTHESEDSWNEGIVEMSRWGESHTYTVRVVTTSPEDALEKAVNNYDPIWRSVGEKGEEAVDQPGFGGSGPSVA